MPIFERGYIKLYYEDHGSGFPVPLIAPGGMRSAVSFWEGIPWNPIEQLSPSYRVIATDQRMPVNPHALIENAISTLTAVA
jgi:pimeloyl-ACP methyl ester carboxylesterase